MPTTKKESVKEPQTVVVCGTEVEFTSGVVEHVYRIVEYTIVQYMDKHGWLAYCVFVEEDIVDTVFQSLDAALIGAVAFKHEGSVNITAVRFMRAIGVHA